MGLQQFDEQLPFGATGTLANDGVHTFGAIAQASFRQTRIDAVYLGNSGAERTTVTLDIDDGSSDIGQLGGIVVPAGAGFTSPAVSAFPLVLDPGQQGVVLPLGFSMRLGVPGGAAEGSVVSFVVLGGLV